MTTSITFDYQIFCRQRFGGISRYIIELTKALATMPGFSPRIFAPLHLNHYLKDDPATRTGLFFDVDRKVGRAMRPFDDFLLKSSNLLRPADIIHQTYYCEFTPPKKSRIVVTVHDMTHELFPEKWSRYDRTPVYKKAAAERADHVICVSQSTKRDLMRICGVPEEKISVIYIGFARLPSKQDPAIAATPSLGQSQGPYILYVGNRGGYKNFDGFVRAFGASSFLRENFRLVAFGGGRFTADEHSLMEEYKIRYDHVGSGSTDNDDTLAEAYRNAAMLIYPSLYEGFGLPPLEAMSLGCPVVASNAGPIPEVSGDAADLFDPHDIEAIRHAMERVATDSAVRNSLIAKGYRRAELFSWERCAEQTAQVYRNITN